MKIILNRFYLSYNSKSTLIQICISFCILSIPMLLIFTPFIITRYKYFFNYTIGMWCGLVFGGIWIAFSPFMIYLFIKKLKHFFIILKDNNISQNLDKLKNICFKKFVSIDWFNILWILLIIGALIIDRGYLERFGLFGFTDVYFYIFIGLIIVILYCTSLGFKGTYIVVQLIRILVKQRNIYLDFFNADGAGGIKCMKDIVSFTTRIFSTGTLFVPILLDYIFYTDSLYVKLILYISIALLAIFILLSYFIPIFKLSNYTNTEKENYLNKLTEKYRKIANISIINSYNGNLEEEIEALNLYNFISYVNDIKLLKIDTMLVLELIISIIIPILSLFFNFNDICNLFMDIFL